MSLFTTRGALRPSGICASLSLAACVVGLGVPAFAASTGNFTSPLTSGVILSVDINGGPIASANATTEGSNGPSASPTLSADPFGVTWSPWGGPTSTNGDGTQLPSSQSSPNVAATSISKAFGGITATVSEIGLASSYGTVNGSESLNSRDRGSPSGAAGDSDLFRDFVFAGSSGSNVQSTNLIQLTITGLTPSSAYKVATYSYDSSGGHTTNWTATAPTTNSGGTVGYDPDPADTFVAPSDEQSITWVAGTTPAEAVFTLTSSASGSVSLWAFGGTGVTGNNNADTTYLDGFQIASVPEPASLGLIGLSSLGLLSRRRKA